MVGRFTRTVALLITHVLVVLILTLGWSFPTAAQILPSLSWSDNDISTESYIPVFNSGNLEIAPVFLDGKVVGVVESFIQLRSGQDIVGGSFYSAATRSHLIHSKLQKILNNMNRYSQQVLPQQGILQLEEQEKELREQLVITVSEEKGNVVVLKTFPQNDVPEIIYTVTPATIERPRFGGSQPSTIAQKAANVIENALIQAWKERQTPYLISQTQRALLVLVALIFTSLILWWIQKYLDTQKRRLQNSLSKAQNIQSPTNSTSDSSSESIKPGMTALHFKQKLSLNQRYSLNALYRAGLFWIQWLFWMIGIGYLTSLFYWSRSLSNWIVGVTINGWSKWEMTHYAPFDWLTTFGREATLGIPLFVLLLLLLARLTLKGGYVLCDFLAKDWSQQQSIQRHSLRVPTLVRAIKGWLTVIVYLFLGVALLYYLHQLGTITQVVAVFLGFFSFAISLASQNLLKDLIGGILVLLEDQYAVGDVVCISDQWGLVEKITLRITQLRNLDGELISIPNGSINMVRNLSSDWSRVNYAVEVSYNADIDLALEVIKAVAQQLYNDPQWQEQILEAPEILGVENISHQGILIRLIIKTQPLQQWPVAREFRRRLKKAFDEQGIGVGIPQQMMYVNESSTQMSNGNVGIDRGKLS